MLSQDPDNRPTIAELRAHPWADDKINNSKTTYE